MSLEQKINYQLNKYPKIKKVIKRLYQRVFYTLSKKVKYEGNVVRVSPDDNYEYFFGYYDKSPWDSSGRYMLCMRAKDTWSDVSPKEPLDILLIDTQNNNNVEKIAESKSWNVQMGCMAQWLGPDFNKEIIYNDFRDGEFCSIILNVFTREERIINAPVFSVSNDGKTALTLDFTRLYSLRPGYGYYNKKEETFGVNLPDTTCIWHIDLASGQIKPLLKYGDFASFSPRAEMQGEEVVHKVNHIMISPNGKRFMVLYRWFVGERKYTRLITCDIDGKNMYLLNDDDMVSHCYWKNDNEIIAFENKNNPGCGPGYYLMKDKTNDLKRLWPKYSNDGHPSYSPNKEFVVTDSYPSRTRMQDIKVLRDNEDDGKVVAKVFAPFKYDNDTRCDLHPRWSRDGKAICFDGCFEGKRRLYIIEVKND